MRRSIGLFFILLSASVFGQKEESAISSTYDEFDEILKHWKKEIYYTRRKGRFGIYNGEGNEILPPIYDLIEHADHINANYLAGFLLAYKEDSTYLLNTNYEKILPYAYDFYCNIGADGNWVVGKNGRIGICQRNGLVTPIVYKDAVAWRDLFYLKSENDQIEVHDFRKDISLLNFEVIEFNRSLFYSAQFERVNYELLILAKQGNQYGVLNAALDTIVAFDYNKTDIFFKRNFIYVKEANSWHCVWLEDGGVNKVPVKNIDLLKKAALTSEYEIVSENGKQGVIDYLGNFIIPPKYDEIERLKRTQDYFFIVQKGKKKAVFSDKGLQMTRFSFETVDSYAENLFRVSAKNKVGIVNLQGKMTVPMRYDNVLRSNGKYYKIIQNNAIGLVDTNGKVLIEPQFSKEIVRSWNSSRRYAQQFQHYENEAGEVTTVSRFGKEIVPANYDTLIFDTRFDNTLQYRILHDYFLVKKDSFYGVVSSEREFVSPTYNAVNEIEFYLDTLVPFERNGKVGYLRLTDFSEQFYGAYDECKGFIGDYAIVKKGDSVGLIDRFCQELLPPEYDKIQLNYSNGNTLNRHILVSAIDSLKPKTGEIIHKSGVYDGQTKRFVVPLLFSEIERVNGYYHQYYFAYDLRKDSSYVFDRNGVGEPLFGMDGNRGYIYFHEKNRDTEAYFRVNNTTHYSADADYYDLRGNAVKFKAKEQVLEEREIPEELEIETEKTAFDSLNEQYDQLELVSGTGYFPELFGLPKLYIAQKENAYGLINDKQEIIAPFIYDDIQNQSNGFLLIEKNGKTGWLSHSGKVILPTVYDEIFNVYTRGDYHKSYDSLYRIKKADKYGLVDMHGKVKVPPIYEELITDFSGVEYQLMLASINSEMFSGQLEPYSFDICDGAYDTGQRKMEAMQDDPLRYTQQIKSVRKHLSIPAKMNGNWGLIDLDGNTIIPFEYDSLIMVTGILAQLEKEGSISFFDLELNQKLPFVCDTVYPFRQRVTDDRSFGNRSEFMFFRSEGKLGILNPFTRKYLPAKYDALEQILYCGGEEGYSTFFLEDGYPRPYGIEKGNTDIHAEEFLIRYKLDEKQGLIDLKALQEITPKLYQHIHIEKQYYGRSLMLGFDDEMTFLLPNRLFFNTFFDTLSRLATSTAINYYGRPKPVGIDYFRTENDGKVGVYDHRGNCVLPMNYEDVSSLFIPDENGNKQFIARLNGKYGVINAEQEILIPFEYDHILLKSSPNFPRHYELIKNGTSVFRDYKAF